MSRIRVPAHHINAERTRDRLHQGRVSRSPKDQLKHRLTACRNAGFFVYIDLSPYLPFEEGLSPREREYALAQKLVDAGVFLHPGEEHSKDVGWFRLVFSQEEDILKEGFRR